jgi:hypothetical protein
MSSGQEISFAEASMEAEVESVPAGKTLRTYP